MREAFRHDLKGIGADPSKCGLQFLRSGGAITSAYSGVSDSVSVTRSLMTLMTIWIEDFLFWNSLGVYFLFLFFIFIFFLFATHNDI